MKIETKFLFSSISVISIIIAFFGGSTFLGNYLQERFDEQDDITDQGLEIIADLKIQIRDEVSDLKNYIVLDKNNEDWFRFKSHESEVIANLKALDDILQDSRNLDRLRNQHTALLNIGNEMRSQEISPENVRLKVRRIDLYQESIQNILRSMYEDLEILEAGNDEYIKSLNSWLIIVRYSGVVVAVLIVFFQLKNTFIPISSSIKELTEKVKQIGSGQLDQKVNIHTGDEIEILAHEFNAMAHQLQDSYHSLEQKVRERTLELTQTNETLKETLLDLQQAQSQLIHHEKMSSLGQLVAGIAHEINNPANFIFGNLIHVSRYIDELLEMIQCYEQYYPQPHPKIQELQEELDLDFVRGDLTQAMNSMQVGVKRIRDIIVSLRTFSRLDEAEQKEVDIHQGIDSTLMILQHRIKGDDCYPEIQIHKDYGEIPFIHCYPSQLNQVFMNILVNAIDSLQEFSQSQVLDMPTDLDLQIQIRTRVVTESGMSLEGSSVDSFSDQNRQSWLEVMIADNGLGIEESVQKQIFDPFFTTKKVGQGTGLGLSMSYQIIVEKHGGKLRCESQLGQGAKFFIMIPV